MIDNSARRSFQPSVGMALVLLVRAVRIAVTTRRTEAALDRLSDHLKRDIGIST
jgi:uncharacterized protein YjiS (DUF1127 family)